MINKQNIDCPCLEVRPEAEPKRVTKNTHFHARLHPRNRHHAIAWNRPD